jgi:predicted ATPase/DNA-binding SARP family transcriptional activator
VEFRVLGPLDVLFGDRTADLGTPRQKALLGLLLLRAGTVVSCERLADDLWDGDPPETARHTVQSYAHRLRRALGPEAWRLQTRAPGYQVKVSAEELDSQRFQQLAEDAHRALLRGEPAPAADLLDSALSLWRGPLLADLPDLAAFEPERGRLTALRLTALEDRFEAGLALGRHATLVAQLEALLREQPLRERLWGQLMLALYRSGRQAEALNAFRHARRVLTDELGIDPSRWLTRLHEQILLQDPALDPLMPRPERPRTNLPTYRTTFVGRRRDLDELQGMLLTRRLVTVTGPAGVGKTRLAVHAAAGITAHFPHGTFFVSLADVDDVTLVASTIAATLEITTTQRPPAQALVDHLRTRRLLLVLDNAEHVLAAAGTVTQLLDAAPALTVLATSRVPLHLSGEQEYRLDPLPTPEPHDLGSELSRHDALALFAERAVAVAPHFRLDADSAPLVAEVVSRLDGLPLAIELAATRLRALPLRELLRRLSPALPLLGGAPVDSAPRHRTLTRAIAWSEQQLPPPDRALFMRLGVFRGGIDLEAAEAIAAGPPVVNVVTGMANLVEASLLEPPGATTADVRARFRMLETTREYAIGQLRRNGAEVEVGRRHARFFAALVQRAEPELTTGAQAAWLTRLDTEHANLRSALAFSGQTGEIDLALVTAGRMWRFWQLRGHLAEGRRCLEDVLAVAARSTDGADPTGPTEAARAKALIGLAGICYWQSDLDAAEDAYHRARARGRQAGDWWLELEALLGLVSTIACHRGDLVQAAPFEDQFQALIAEHPDPFAMGFGLATSQLMRLFAGELEESRRYGEQLVQACRELGQRWYEGQTLRTLGYTSLRQKRYEQAEIELSQSLHIAAEARDVTGAAIDLDRLALAAVGTGQPTRAVVLAGAAAALREAAGGGLPVEAFRWETEHPKDTARRFLSEGEIDRAWARGRTMTLDDAIAFSSSAR